MPPGRVHRRWWVGRGRAHVEVRGLHQVDGAAFARQVEAALERLDGVHWAELHAVTGRVVVAFDGDALTLDDLVGVVEGIEDAHGVRRDRFPHERPDHPADTEPLQRQVLALAADVVGLGVSTAGQVLHLVPLPGELAGLVSLADSERRVRGLLEARVGRGVTDVGLAATNAMAQALAQGPLGLLVDVAHRANLVGEIQARRGVWTRREPSLYNHRGLTPAVPPDEEGRPVPLRAGPVEHYADRAALASLGAFGLTLGATRDPRRAADVLFAGIPKAARLGREAFAAQFDRVLATRGVVVMDPAVLRRLDRIDTVVVDAELLADPLWDELRATITTAGHDLVVLGGAPSLVETIGARRVGDTHPREAIRTLQREGRTVALISARHHAAMHAADCGLGVERPGSRPPWGAHLLCGPGLANPILVIDATRTAVEVSRRGALLALGGSSTGAIWAIVGPRRGAAQRSLVPINGAAMLSIAAGGWSGWALGNRPVPRAALQQPWHALDAAAALSTLGSRAEGLETHEAQRRRLRDEEHSHAAPPPGLWRATVAELANPLTPLLGVGAALSAAVGSMTDAALVGSVVAANALVSGAQRVRTETSIAKLTEQDTAPVSVRRGGAVVEVAPDELVVGDVIELRSGDLIPADCRILEAVGLEVDESALTGESLPVPKNAEPAPDAAVADRRCMLYADTTIAVGDATALVVATGTATEAGRSLAAARTPPASGVEARLTTLTRVTMPITLASGAAVAGLGLLRRRSPREAIGAGVSLMVAAVPEGLPLLASTAQLAAARRLAARHALVRNPRAIEALGRADVLCFDKTGTLTEGRIALRLVSDGTASHDLDTLVPASRRVLAAALRAAPAGDGGVLPHATDQAVVDAADTAGIRPDDGLDSWARIDELAFESSRGYHATLGRAGAGTWLSVKGAPEVIVPRCSTWRTPTGLLPINRHVRRRVDATIEQLARAGYRVLAVAEKPAAATTALDEFDELELFGFLGFADLVRPSAASALAGIRRAGVDVVMITGDHPSTAEAIAAELGLLNGGRVISGSELDHLDDTTLDAMLSEITVFARVAPTQKVRIVEAYQRGGRIVAMTGDGSNDAPALRLAHAGIALGQRGTAAAKQAADVIVLDDRIETIIDAIVEGRAMWTSVRDALSILIGGNLGEVAFTLTGSLLTGRSPLGARQLLLVNLLTDMLPALAIALRPPTGITPDDLIHEGPDASLGAALTRDIAIRAAATAAGATSAWLLARASGTPTRARTVGLVALVGTQLGQTLIAGGTSPLVLGSVILSTGLLVGIVQTPGLSQFFECRPLGPLGWTTATLTASTATLGSVLVPAAIRGLTATPLSPARPAPHEPAAAIISLADHSPTGRGKKVAATPQPEQRVRDEPPL